MAIQKKICMLGSFGVGKTSLVSQLVHSIFAEEYLSTIGVKIDKKVVQIGEEVLDFILWDLAGDDRFDSLQSTYLMGTSAFVLVIDGCRFDTVQVAKDIMQTHAPILANLPFVCAVNKSDLRADWEVNKEHIDELRVMGWPVITTTAKNKDGVEELFCNLGSRILEANRPVNV